MVSFVLCADDFALTKGVSRGILRLLERGRISATGAMTNRPHWRAMAGELSAFAGRADLGVHLNLTCAEPLTPMPRFAPGGVFAKLPAVLKGGLSYRLPVAELVGEINAQLSAFEDAMGRAPDFIDGHQHVHGLPGVRDVFLEVVAQRYGGPAKPYIRVSGDCLTRIAARRVAMAKALQVTLLSSGFRRRVKALGFPLNNGFAGFSPFDPAQSYAEQFASYLVAPGTRHLVMCHPGDLDAELPGLDPVVATREQEQRFFESAAFEEAVETAGIRVARFGATQPPSLRGAERRSNPV